MKNLSTDQQVLDNRILQSARYKIKSLESYAIPKILSAVEDMNKSVANLKEEVFGNAKK